MRGVCKWCSALLGHESMCWRGLSDWITAFLLLWVANYVFTPDKGMGQKEWNKCKREVGRLMEGVQKKEGCRVQDNAILEVKKGKQW